MVFPYTIFTVAFSFTFQTTDPSIFDVVIVGSGPSGACLGYYLVKKGRKVLTLEKKKFPRDKICGDALCKTGIEILRDMGLYKKLLDENKAHVVSCFVCIESANVVVQRGDNELQATDTYFGCIKFNDVKGSNIDSYGEVYELLMT